ncbi:MAG: DUF192 domain-containing protein [Ignavibacteriales bacterium]|nr:DUF192 domain-containing protein [Ignavibacteriales bacterium]
MKISKACILFLLCGVFSVFVSSCKDDEKVKTENSVVINDKEVKNDNQVTVKFTKQGELTFNTGNGDFIATINIEIADDDSKREQGLMYRDKMEENQGMLFIFPVEEPRSFWMSNTMISLDIIFVNSKNEIVKIHKNTTPYSRTSYPSDAPAQFVVEVITGFTDKYNIKEGDKVVWRRM